ncbi:MAG: type IV toxin-antitoxin system AbiEi family antitoxin domain-containing protein [Thermoplasmata archaeon]
MALPTFTTKQLSVLFNSENYKKIYLYRLKKRGVIRKLIDSVYTCHEDPMIYATHIFYPSYISLWSAFQYYGTTTQLPLKVQVIGPKNFNIESVEMISSSNIWGYKKIKYRNFEVFMADLEKAIIDSIISGKVPLEELNTAIIKTNKAKMQEYALRVNNNTAKIVGYLYEINGIEMNDLYYKIKNDRNYVKIPFKVYKNRWRVKGD